MSGEMLSKSGVAAHTSSVVGSTVVGRIGGNAPAHVTGSRGVGGEEQHRLGAGDQASSSASVTMVLPLLIGLLCGGVIAWLVAKVYYLEHRSKDRKLSVKQSAATTLGYVSEKVAPLLPQFPYTHKDLVFLGKGVDYICFDGLSEGRVRQIVFLEIKTGKSTLNANEQRIKDAIDKGRVSWETLRIGV